MPPAQMHAGPHPACVSREIAAHRLHIVDDDPGVVEQAFARRGQLNAAAAALQKRNAKRCFQALDPRARRRQREMGAERAARDAALGGNRDKQLEVDQVETHGDCPGFLPPSWPKARSIRCRLCPELRAVNVVGMFEPLLILIAAAFLLAGFIKGAIGMGLPTVSMGLLAVTMQPSRALAIVIVPAIITNIWQTFVGPYLRDIIRRLWPLMVGTVVGIWLNAGMLTGPYARYGTIVLGVLLVIYAIVGLSKFSFSVARSDEKWIGGIVGLITGVVSAATGVQVIPSMPFMQAIGMEEDELVQALGVFFTVATLGLAFNLTSAGLLTAATARCARGCSRRPSAAGF